MMITQETIKELLHYDPDTGVFRWRCPLSRRVLPWSEAGTIDGKGYRTVGLFGKKYLAHRLAWLYTTGGWPNKQIDHINKVKTDNRVENLRDVPQNVNMQNTDKRIDNTSGHTGVSWQSRTQQWCAKITVNGKRKHLGYYDDFELACLVADEAKDKYHTKATKELTGHTNENSSRLRNGLEAQ